MGERIKKLRKALGLTQKEFGERIGVKPNTIGTYEIDRNKPIDAVISLICREFGVNETWLRTGQGEMFATRSRNEELAAQIESFFQGGTDSFRERLISLLLRLSPEQWDALEEYAQELTSQAAPARTDTNIEQEADAAASEVREQVILEKKVGAKSSASPSDTGGAAGKKMA